MRHARGLVREIRRKGFHLTGLIIPGVYFVGVSVTRGGEPLLSRSMATIALGVITGVYLGFEILRLLSPRVNEFCIRRLRFLMRRGEVRQITGSGYYLLGSCFAVALFDPAFAIAAILFMVLGDPAAALVGKAIGRTRLLQKKTLEGSLACLATCFVLGVVLFHQVGTPWVGAAQVAIIGAVAAAVAELLPLRIDDNVTIPVVSGLALMVAAKAMGVDVTLP